LVRYLKENEAWSYADFLNRRSSQQYILQIDGLLLTAPGPVDFYSKQKS
ncbi:8129_t:CDS:1, partial [Ambispora leptoticha]